eukprot:3722767-Prymnesium_polylepis.1
MGQWKLRWYSLSVDGELTCHRQRSDVDRKAPLFATFLDQLRVSLLPPERQQHELDQSGVFGFKLEWVDASETHVSRLGQTTQARPRHRARAAAAPRRHTSHRAPQRTATSALQPAHRNQRTATSAPQPAHRVSGTHGTRAARAGGRAARERRPTPPAPSSPPPNPTPRAPRTVSAAARAG